MRSIHTNLIQLIVILHLQLLTRKSHIHSRKRNALNCVCVSSDILCAIVVFDRIFYCLRKRRAYTLLHNVSQSLVLSFTHYVIYWAKTQLNFENNLLHGIPLTCVHADICYDLLSSSSSIYTYIVIIGSGWLLLLLQLHKKKKWKVKKRNTFPFSSYKKLFFYFIFSFLLTI